VGASHLSDGDTLIARQVRLRDLREDWDTRYDDDQAQGKSNLADN
jgi:hypothetical protein